MRRLLEEYSSILITAIPACALLALFSGMLAPWFSNIYPDTTRVTVPMVTNSYDFSPVLLVDDTLEVYLGTSNTGNDHTNLYLGSLSFQDLEARLLSTDYVKAWGNSKAWESGTTGNVTVSLVWWDSAGANYNVWKNEAGLHQLMYCVKNNTTGFCYYRRVSLLVTEYRDRVV